MSQQEDENKQNEFVTLNFAINLKSNGSSCKLISKFFDIDPKIIGSTKPLSTEKNYSFHICLIRIGRVLHTSNSSTNDASKLNKYIGNFIQSQLRQEPLTFTPYKTGRYKQGSKRGHNRSPIVLFPTPKETKIFKAFNLLLQGRLAMFNAINNTNYIAGYETNIEEYLPHVTLLKQPWIWILIGFKQHPQDKQDNEKLQQLKSNIINVMDSIIDKENCLSERLPVPGYKLNRFD